MNNTTYKVKYYLDVESVQYVVIAAHSLSLSC